MHNSIIKEKLKEYDIKTVEQENNAIKEIIQEIILYGLSTTDFFQHALFQGGTALRILYGLKRFSEDLDFLLKKNNPEFKWEKYIESIQFICKEYGIISRFLDKNKADGAIKRLFIKNDSIGNLIELTFKQAPALNIMIKLEVDINPPLGSIVETKYLDFPLIYAVETQDLSSNFASTSHALLCRPYVKGRDWYDFIWYVSKKITPNLQLLQNAIDQNGPWKNQHLIVTPDWYFAKLSDKIEHINWHDAKADVERFLNAQDRQQLSLWGKELFLDRIQKIKNYML